MSSPDCPECEEQIRHEDTFGNLAYAIWSTGTTPTCGTPKKAGDIYRCDRCDEHYHTFDGCDAVLHHGYPC